MNGDFLIGKCKVYSFGSSANGRQKFPVCLMDIFGLALCVIPAMGMGAGQQGLDCNYPSIYALFS